MGGTAIKVHIDDNRVRRHLGEVMGRMRSKRPALRIIGSIIRTSVVRNFEKGGRPERWQESKRVKKSGGTTLVRKGFGGGLLGSINVHVGANEVSVGTNKEYAAIHQFGGTVHHPAHERILHFKTFQRGPRLGRTLFAKPGKASHAVKITGGPYDITMPKRPFLLIQDEDWTEMTDAVNDFLLRGKR